MRNFVTTAALAGLLLAAIPAAQAAVHSYSVSGTIDSGHYLGESYSGSFSFDDSGLLGVDTEWTSLTALSFSILGHHYGLADADAPAEAAFSNGSFVGVAYSVSASEPQFSLNAGSSNIGEAFLAYDTKLGVSGAGNVVYAPVPEADSYALLLAGLGLLGFMARRRRLKD
jgi:MYXO-CTERM domain-containing protein